MPSMRGVVISRSGGPEVLEVGEVPTPEPGPGQVRVRVRAFGINRADLLQRRGLYPPPSDAPRNIPGLEYAGEIDVLGAGVRDQVVGDRVMGIVGGGAYAEYVTTPAAHVLPVPEGLSFQEAAAIPEAFLTAHDALEQLGVAAGEWVMIHAVGSGVGTAALQLVLARRARCIGTSRTPAKLERAAALGMDVGVNTVTEDLVAKAREITGRGVQAVLDLVGGPRLGATLEALAPRGRLILVGLTAGARAEVDLRLILGNRLRIIGTVLRSRSTDEKTMLVRSFREAVLPLFPSRRVHAILDRVYDFREIRSAHQYVESNANFGKVVVRLS